MRSPTKFFSLLISSLVVAASYTLPVAANSSLDTNFIGGSNNPIQNQPLQATQLFKQGIEQYRSHQYQDGLNTYQQLLKIYREVGDEAGEARTLHNLGLISFYLKEPAQAIELLQQSLNIREKINDHVGTARSLDNMRKIKMLQAQTMVSPSTEINLNFDEDDKPALRSLDASTGDQNLIPESNLPATQPSDENEVLFIW
ncbi:MAG: tetratricopeptide repeat protein [Crinalium sp.]